MEFKFRATEKQVSNFTYGGPPSSNFTYFAEQALRSHYSNPNPNSNPNLSRYNQFYQHPIDAHREMIQRQIEKERIREEIIAAEIARRRELEAEVRRELMLERQRGDPFPVMPGQQAPLYSRQSEVSSLEERIALSLERRCRGYSAGRSEIGGFGEELPFQRSSQPKISEIVPSEVSKEKAKDKIIFLDKPDGNLSGTKRKAETPPTAGTGQLPLLCWKKKSKEEWSCAICKVSATCERGLNEHLQGKRHKAKEAGLRAQKSGKNYSIGLCSKKNEKPTKPTEVTGNPTPDQGGKFKGKSSYLNKWKVESSKRNDTDDSKNKNGEALNKIQKVSEDKKKKFRFWCEMCQAGAFSEKVMNNHMKGKKHVFRLEELKKNGEAIPGIQMAGVAFKANGEAVVVVEDGKKDVTFEVNGEEMVVEDGRKDAPICKDVKVDSVEVEDHQAGAE